MEAGTAANAQSGTLTSDAKTEKIRINLNNFLYEFAEAY
jgi:hypothetical protein